ncbi:MAG: GHKL domain-containing protein [Cellulosilyticum sp.]|nr:GHKL domain-containing protein [Cellulosilyticum sp.]
MMYIIYQLMEFVVCFVESVIFYIFIEHCCQKRIKSPALQCVLLLSVTMSIFVKEQFSLSSYQSMIYGISVWCIYAVIQFKTECWKYIFYVGFYFCICYICDFIALQLHCLLYVGETIESIQLFSVTRYNIAIISKLLLCIVVFGIAMIENRTKNIGYYKVNQILILITTVISIVSLCGLEWVIWYSLRWRQDNKVEIVVCSLSLCIFIMTLIVYGVIKKLNISIQKENDYALITYQNELLVKWAEGDQAIENEWRKIRHDFNNHISCIDMLLQMGDIEKARAYIQKLTQNSQEQTVSLDIGNTIANAVVTQKVMFAKQHDIFFEVKGYIPEILDMEDIDLCALLSNSIDNAIEATSKIEEKEQRKITLVISSDEKDVGIKLSNTVKENIPISKPLSTTKKDVKRHGIGMRSMQEAVSKYKGTLSWKCEAYLFVLDIRIPLSY